MFKSNQRNFAQRNTRTTDNRPTMTIGVKVGVQDTYITNKTSNYGSKVFEPKGSKFITVADVDFTPTEPGIYTLPLTDEDASLYIQQIRTNQNLNDTVVLNTQVNPISSRTIEILPRKNHYLKGFSFTDGGLAEALIKAFENKDRTDGYFVLQATKDGYPYLLTLTNDGEIVPFVRLRSTLHPEVIPSTPETPNIELLPEVLGGSTGGFENLLNNECCCDSDSDPTDSCDIEGWNWEPSIWELESGEWSPQNPCGYLGSSRLCTCQIAIEIVNATTGQVIYEGVTSDEQFDERGYDPNPNNPNAPPGYRPCNYNPENGPNSRWSQTVAIARCTTSTYSENCYYNYPPTAGTTAGTSSVCVVINKFCQKTLGHYFGNECGCDGCPCSEPFCEGNPNCPPSEGPPAGRPTLPTLKINSIDSNIT